MGSIIFGTSNTDGTGSSANLNEENGFVVNESGYFEEQGVLGIISDDGTYLQNIFIAAEEWNGKDVKEVSLVDTSASNITIENFVDANIINSTDVDTHIELLQAKRGQIDTSGGASSDAITIGVKANNNIWDNLFDINTGEGNDTVSFVNVENSQWTDFQVQLGEGNDELDVSLLDLAVNSDQVRVVDGGQGLDTLVTNGDSILQFTGMEVIVGAGLGEGSVLNVDNSVLANNNDVALGLVISNVDVEFGADINAYQSHALTDEQAAYLDQEGFDSSGFSSVSIFAADGQEYIVLTDDAEFNV
ncbi:hypothetical protein AB2S62_19450 [Vibrio sp. NTOU-M3]|uniref:hypothetical protein n=1 Tax=Vibrio sp. NTOU-M3 TaxID=3234954 RepID=UPI00349F8325